MPIAVFLATGAINRLMRQAEEAGILPSIEGRIGRSELLHACYTASLVSLPRIETSDGTLTLRAPIEGTVSIPWGMGVRYLAEARADVRARAEGDRTLISVAGLDIEDLRLNLGCSFPKGLLAVLGPFVQSFLFRGLGVSDGHQLRLPPIRAPLSSAKPGTPPLELRVRDIRIVPEGVIMLIGMEDDPFPPAPLPDPGPWDLTVAVCEGTAEDIAARAVEEIGDIEGRLSFAIPDARTVADLMLASAETLTTLGRRGLGKRAIRNASTIEVSYIACAGRPNLSFGEGGKIILCKIPARIHARADLVLERFKGGTIDRLMAFLRRAPEKDAPRTERTTVRSWDIDGDFVLERAEITVKRTEGSLPRLELTDLDIELDLPWPLPTETLGKIAESMGREIVSSRLPKVLSEVPIPSERSPFDLKMIGIDISTCCGRLAVQADLELVPRALPLKYQKGTEEEARSATPSVKKGSERS